MNNVNIIVNGFHDERQFSVMERLLKEIKPDSVHWVTTRACEAAARERFPSVTLLFWEDLFWGLQNYARLQECLPLDSGLVDDLAQCEMTALRMMDRFTFKREFTYSERKTCYLEYLRFWNDYVKKHSINFFFSQNVPHEVYDYVLLAVCKLHGIKTLMFYQSQINDVIVPMQCYDSGVIGLKPAVASYAVADNEIILPKHVEGELLRAMSKQSPFYMADSSKLQSALAEIRRVVKAMLSPDEYYRKKLNPAYLRYRLILARRQREIRRATTEMAQAYDAVATIPVPGEQYVYLALHYQPELTTSPLAGPFVDQELVVEMLAASLPEGMKVYVKEHPKQTAIGRSPKFYSKYSGYRNVRFISKTYSSFELIDNAFCVATCTGTVGWEAIVRGKSVLTFGDIFFDCAPGAFKIRTVEDLTSAIQSIQTCDISDNRSAALRSFLAGLVSVSIYGFCDAAYAAVSTTDFDTSNKNIAEYVVRYVQDCLREVR